MTVDYIYQYLLKLIKKNQAGGLSAAEFGYFWNGRQSSYFGDLMGRFQKNNNSKEGINTGLIQSEPILIKLSPFTKTITLPITTGVLTRPDDFIYRLALRVNGAEVIVATSDKIWSINDDVIDPPSVADNSYYAYAYGSTYVFNPPSIASADLDYIAAPTDVKWNFTIDPTTQQQVYSPAGSVDPQWDDISNREITEGVLKALGVSFSSKDFEGFGQSVIQTGS